MEVGPGDGRGADERILELSFDNMGASVESDVDDVVKSS